MRWLMCAVVVLAGCDSFSDVPCSKGCSQYGAVCNPKTNQCEKGVSLDMAVSVSGDDMVKTVVHDMSEADGPPPPMCTPSTAATDCADPTKPVCGGNGQCRACMSGDDAVCMARSISTPRCALSGANAGSCVACTTATQASDCTDPTKPICGSDNTCRGCVAHAECPSLGMWSASNTITATPISGICVFEDLTVSSTTYKAGSCAPANKVAFVDNGELSITSCKANGNPHDGTTPAKAYCDVQDAVIASQPFVAVAGRGTTADYGDPTRGGTVVAIARSVSIVGPGKSASVVAQVSSGASTSPCVSVTGTTTAVIDGLDIADATGGIASYGLQCSTGTTVIARRNNIRSADAGGVHADTCTLLTLDGNDITSNSGGGVTLTATKYSLTNNVIGANTSTTSYGIKFNDSPAGSIFAFNTVAANAATNNANAPGVICNAATTLQSSIVANNIPLLTGSQFSGSCTLTSVVTGPDSATGANMSPPALTTTYRLDISNVTAEGKNKTCCIDKITTAPGTPFSNHDVDFKTRPLGNGWDIGASEAE